MKIEKEICLLCLEKCKIFKAIDGNTKDILNKLLPKIDSSVIKGPVICTNCEKMLIKWFDFKTACSYREDYIVQFVDKNNVQVDLKDIYLGENAADLDICRFCMGTVESRSAVTFDVEAEGIKMMERCLPELDVNIVKKHVICFTCYKSLEDCFCFVTNCLIVEEKIKKYRETLDVNSRGQIDLSNVLQFTKTTKVDGNWINKIKAENDFCEEIENPDKKEIVTGGDTIKLEPIFYSDSEEINEEVDDKNKSFVIVDELKFQEEQFPSDNVYVCKQESDNVDMIKTENVFDGKSEVKKENLAEMGDQKLVVKEETEIKTDKPEFVRYGNDVIMSNLADELLSSPHVKQILANKDGTTNITKFQLPSCSFQAKMFRCDACAYETVYKCYLKRHLLVHKETTYRCASCPFQTKHKHSFKGHSLMHKSPSEVTLYECADCSFRTKRKSSLSYHSRRHRDASEVTSYRCDACSFETRHRNSIKYHLLRHKDASEVATFKCEFCPFRTKYKDSIRGHALVHKDASEVTMYDCDACTFRTRDKYYLNRHRAAHKKSKTEKSTAKKSKTKKSKK